MLKDRLFRRLVSYLMLVFFLTFCTTMTVWTRSRGQTDSTPSKPLVFAANVRNGGGSGLQNQSVTIYLNEFSGIEEVKELVEMLRTRGPDPVVNKLALMDRGRFSPVGRVGTNIAMIRAIDTEKGRVIRALASRPETFRELYGMPGRSQDYPFGFVELRVDKDGKGEGSLIMAAKIDFDKAGMLQMESLDDGQLRLVNVRPLK